MTKQQVRDRLIKRYNAKDRAPLAYTRSRLTDDRLIPELMNFIAAFPSFARSLFDLHGAVPHLGSRLGRGEVLVYFVFDDVELGGSSSSCDVIINNEPVLEIKCAKRDGDRYAHFMLGIDEVQASFQMTYKILQLFTKNDKAGKLKLPQNFANISKTRLEELKDVSPVAFKNIIESYYDDLLSGPIGTKKFLIFDQITMLPIYFGFFKREQLKVERISGGLTRLSFKP